MQPFQQLRLELQLIRGGVITLDTHGVETAGIERVRRIRAVRKGRWIQLPRRALTSSPLTLHSRRRSLGNKIFSKSMIFKSETSIFISRLFLLFLNAYYIFPYSDHIYNFEYLIVNLSDNLFINYICECLYSSFCISLCSYLSSNKYFVQ